MSDPVIPEDVEQFLLRDIDSIVQWEGLLLLRADAGKEWSAHTVARRLYVSEQEAGQLLAQLVSRGLLAATEKQPVFYYYQPKPPDLERLIARAADTYQHYLIPVTHLIHSKSRSRIQKFADAFRIRKD